MSGRLLRVRDWEQLAKEADFQPAKLADLLFVSSRQLQRHFSEFFHSTPSHWLRQLQCNLAKDLISKGYSNKAVVAELKFASQSHFCREFKKTFGSSPQAFAPVCVNHVNNVANGQLCR